ncbi:hypothetical protein E2C01_003145 [Portunus trituberculatus]|uniref:Uncharacterized protein n=1 Tax=Portunus trituberculatus TaxID=210409 RepID=A0A5B7CLT6_PORTR|nr:hypothetical protein [Portunus trituberculatus]
MVLNISQIKRAEEETKTETKKKEQFYDLVKVASGNKSRAKLKKNNPDNIWRKYTSRALSEGGTTVVVAAAVAVVVVVAVGGWGKERQGLS